MSQVASVSEIFEKHGLLGTWSVNCTKPLSKQNRYAVYRALDADHVQREVKSDPATAGALSIADRASESGPNEVNISWVDGADGGRVPLRVIPAARGDIHTRVLPPPAAYSAPRTLALPR